MTAESAVQFSANFDRNGHKLLRKTEQLVQRVGGHALAIFADRKHTCHLYASNALQTLHGDLTATMFFRDELVNNQHPGQHLFPIIIRSKQLPKAEVFDQDPHTRHKTWKQRWSTLEAFTNQMAECQPDRAFCLYIHSGKDSHTLTKSSPQLQGIFQRPGWEREVQQRLQKAGVPAPNASTTSQASATASTDQHANTSASDHASMPKRRKRRKVATA